MRAPAGNTRSRSRSTLAVLMTMRPPSLRRSSTLMSYVLRTRSDMSRSRGRNKKPAVFGSGRVGGLAIQCAGASWAGAVKLWAGLGNKKARFRLGAGRGAGFRGRAPGRNLRRGYGIVNILNPFLRIGNWPDHAIVFDYLSSRAMILRQPPNMRILLARQEVEPGHVVLTDHRAHQDDHGAPDLVPKFLVADVGREFSHG